MESTPTKKPRGMEFRGGARQFNETPVRDRHEVDNSPPVRAQLAGFDSPITGQDTPYSSPSNGVTST
jgi:hypothetical protein